MKENKFEIFVLNKEGNVSKVLNYLPLPFYYEYRYDLIKRAVLTELQNIKQPKGADILAGKRTTAESWGVGYGVARVPRVKGSGYPRASQAAFAPNTVKGYNPTAPKVNKILRVKKTINIRAGKGKRRGRKYKERKSILLVVYDNEPVKYAFKNLPGVDVVDIRNIKVHDLAPGCLPGRLTIWTLKAFEYLAKKYNYIS